MGKIATEMQNDYGFKLFIKKVKKTPLLTQEEELELARRIANGDKAAIQRLIEANLRLVIKIGQKYLSYGISLMDIIQEGNVGLMYAAEKFDISRNARFSTYASMWIKQAIARFVASKCRTIRIPLEKEKLLRKIHIVEHKLRQKFEREPNVEEIACELDRPASEIQLVMTGNNNTLSLETEFADDADSAFREFHGDNHKYNPEHEFLMRSSSAETKRFLKRHLSARERNVIVHRFQLVDSEIHSLKKIGDTMGLTAEAVRQIEKRALNKIRNKSEELLDCVYA
jgi:RNA polymerase primary sigma factor